MKSIPPSLPPFRFLFWRRAANSHVKRRVRIAGRAACPDIDQLAEKYSEGNSYAVFRPRGRVRCGKIYLTVSGLVRLHGENAEHRLLNKRQ